MVQQSSPLVFISFRRSGCLNDCDSTKMSLLFFRRFPALHRVYKIYNSSSHAFFHCCVTVIKLHVLSCVVLDEHCTATMILLSSCSTIFTIMLQQATLLFDFNHSCLPHRHHAPMMFCCWPQLWLQLSFFVSLNNSVRKDQAYFIVIIKFCITVTRQLLPFPVRKVFTPALCSSFSLWNDIVQLPEVCCSPHMVPIVCRPIWSHVSLWSAWMFLSPFRKEVTITCQAEFKTVIFRAVSESTYHRPVLIVSRVTATTRLFPASFFSPVRVVTDRQSHSFDNLTLVWYVLAVLRHTYPLITCNYTCHVMGFLSLFSILVAAFSVMRKRIVRSSPLVPMRSAVMQLWQKIKKLRNVVSKHKNSKLVNSWKGKNMRYSYLRVCGVVVREHADRHRALFVVKSHRFHEQLKCIRGSVLARNAVERKRSWWGAKIVVLITAEAKIKLQQ